VVLDAGFNFADDSGKSARCVRCGGNWKRDYGGFYTGTQGETPDTAKELCLRITAPVPDPTKLILFAWEAGSLLVSFEKR
jgi:hypothetical protein